MAQGGTAPNATRQIDAGSLTPAPERIKADRSTARIIMRGGWVEGGARRRIRVDFKPE